jgi:hypothetical protein
LKSFGGPQTIANIEESCVSIRATLAESGAVELDLTAVTEVDLAFVQLLVATRKSAATVGKALRWHVAADGPIAAVLARAGLESASLLEEGIPQ